MKASGLTRELYPSRDREASLRIPPAAGIDVKSDRPYDLAQFSIGQGKVLVSPMHVTMMMAGIANRGLCVQPRVELEGAVRPLGRICSPQDALVLSGMLREVVLRGTGRGIRTSVLSVAGKTGTAQTGPRTESHSWFAGFAPAENPRWAFCVLVENGGYGSAAAVPLANALFETGVRRGWLTP
jgi:peptidoglycan glycosyltransferase